MKKNIYIYIHIYIQSLFCTPESLSINYTSTENQSEWKKKKQTNQRDHILALNYMSGIIPKTLQGIRFGGLHH